MITKTLLVVNGLTGQETPITPIVTKDSQIWNPDDSESKPVSEGKE